MMSIKRKQPANNSNHNRTQNALSPQQQLAQARQAHAKGAIGMEDYIWAAMQCYAADNQAGHKRVRN